MTIDDLIIGVSYLIDHQDGDFGSYMGDGKYLGYLRGEPGHTHDCLIFDCGRYGLRRFSISDVTRAI